MAERKTIYTLNVGDHCPEITQYTYPTIRHYAQRIGAEHVIIDDRFYGDDVPITYEKLQIWHLSRERDDEWSIYIDSDAMLHPNLPDYTALIQPGHVCFSDTDWALLRWDSDEYFQRDGRFIGAGNWFSFTHKWCRDLWCPLGLVSVVDWDNVLSKIHPTVEERSWGVTPEHLIDDYVLSRNIARFGLKVTTLKELDRQHNIPEGLLYHQYKRTTEEKLNGVYNDEGEKIEVGILDVLAAWQINVETAAQAAE